jgi:hypothetical protein
MAQIGRLLFGAQPQRTERLWSLAPVRYACYYSCLFAIIFFGMFGHHDFIYFQF